MTGWQGEQDGQGDPYRPEQYGYPPYGYHPDPRQFDTDPRGTASYSYEAGTPYTGGFPAQDGGPDPTFDPYPSSGFPAPDFGPPPPKRSKLPMILGVLAIVIIVGAVVTIVLVNRDSGGNSASPPPPSSSSSKGKPAPPSPKKPGERDGWQTVDNSTDARLTYQVPPDWKVSGTPRASGLGVDFTGTAEYGRYDCQGTTYVRSFATSGDVQSKKGTDLDLDKTVSDFAKSFAAQYFEDSAKVDLGKPEKADIDGKDAATLTVTVTPKVKIPKCQASKAEIAIVGVILEKEGTPTGAAMLAVVSDVSGGPTDPKSLPKDVAQNILASARLGSP